MRLVSHMFWREIKKVIYTFLSPFIFSSINRHLFTYCSLL